MSINHTTFVAAVQREIGQCLFGLDNVVRLCLVAFYTEGHVLLEGNPGLGKTELVKTLSSTLRLPFKRIQFTPDLMPADITGSLLPDRENINRLTFQKGPIFTHLLLADEINRATPKTQSAMLQAMAEKEVTVLGENHQCPRPFMVLATQNPIDHEGTYTLPEAQSDRFMFQIDMPTPGLKTVQRILDKTAGSLATPLADSEERSDPASLSKNEEDAKERFSALKTKVRESKPQLIIQNHITNMFMASNGSFHGLEDIHRRQLDLLKQWQQFWSFGLGPRAITALMLGAKAWALLFNKETEMADGRALAQVILPALRHRVRLSFEWRDLYRRSLGIDDQQNINVDQFILAFFIATAPKNPAYHSMLLNTFGETLCPELKKALKKLI